MLLCQSLNLNRIVNLIMDIYIYIIYNIVYQHRLLDLLKRDDTRSRPTPTNISFSCKIFIFNAADIKSHTLRIIHQL